MLMQSMNNLWSLFVHFNVHPLLTLDLSKHNGYCYLSAAITFSPTDAYSKISYQAENRRGVTPCKQIRAHFMYSKV